MRHPRERGRKGAPPTREEGQSSPLPLLPPTTTTPPFSTQKLGEHHQGKSGENSTSSKDDDTLRARGEPTSHRGLLARMFWTVSPLAACSPRRWEMEIWARALSAMEGRTREGGGRGGAGVSFPPPFFWWCCLLPSLLLGRCCYALPSLFLFRWCSLSLDLSVGRCLFSSSIGVWCCVPVPFCVLLFCWWCCFFPSSFWALLPLLLFLPSWGRGRPPFLSKGNHKKAGEGRPRRPRRKAKPDPQEAKAIPAPRKNLDHQSLIFLGRGG